MQGPLASRGGQPGDADLLSRLEGKNAERTVDLYERLFSPEEGRAGWLRHVLQEALDDYVRNTGARRVVGFELRRYVKNRPSSRFEAYRALEDLDVFSRIGPTDYIKAQTFEF